MTAGIESKVEQTQDIKVAYVGEFFEFEAENIIYLPVQLLQFSCSVSRLPIYLARWLLSEVTL